jgi:hypothetical protein
MMATRRKSYFPFVLLGLIISGCVALYFFIDPTRHAWMPQCPFRLLTGWNCPACGLQRALHALLHGRFQEAFSYNYFFIVSIPYLIALLIAEVLKQRHRGQDFIRAVEHPFIARTYIVLFIVWGIVRNLLHV